MKVVYVVTYSYANAFDNASSIQKIFYSYNDALVFVKKWAAEASNIAEEQLYIDSIYEERAEVEDWEGTWYIDKWNVE